MVTVITTVVMIELCDPKIHVRDLIPSITVLGDRPFNEVNKVK